MCERVVRSPHEYLNRFRLLEAVVTQPRLRGRTLRLFNDTKADTAAWIRHRAVVFWRQFDRQAKSDAAVTYEVMGIRPPRQSSRGRQLSRTLNRLWTSAALHRVRRCTWPDCDVPGGGFFLAKTISMIAPPVVVFSAAILDPAFVARSRGRPSTQTRGLNNRRL